MNAAGFSLGNGIIVNLDSSCHANMEVGAGDTNHHP